MTQLNYKNLYKKWKERHHNLQKKLWSKHRESLEWFSNNYRQLVSGSLGGIMLLTGQVSSLPPVPIISTQSVTPNVDKKVFLISDLAHVLPKEIRPLNSEEEKDIIEILSRTYGIEVAAEIDGKRMNRNYGYIGQEQHLTRYPGENFSNHFDSEKENNLYWQHGMAPGLGAWRYFADSKEEMTNLDKDREKYYIAVPTFLSKDFSDRFAEYRDFFKFRKVLVVNPNNGHAIVADIADSGPAEWTGKNLGGSPEVMHYLERSDGLEKGAVLYFFISDPDDKIKLGPIEI